MRQTNTKFIIVNALAFQVVWFICVQGNNTLALAAGVMAILFHFAIFKPDQTERTLMAWVIGLGILGDNLILNTGFVEYSNSYTLLNFSFSPLWLVALWFAFGTTLLHSMRWLLESPKLAGLLGFLVVPFSYYAGIKLSDSVLAEGMAGYLFFVLEGTLWACLLFIASVSYKRRRALLCEFS